MEGKEVFAKHTIGGHMNISVVNINNNKGKSEPKLKRNYNYYIAEIACDSITS